VIRANRPNTWLHRPALHVKKTLASREPSTHGTSAKFERARLMSGSGRTAAIFLPPLGVGVLMTLRFARIPVGQHARAYWPYLLALLAGMMLIICIPELSLFLPRSAGLVR